MHPTKEAFLAGLARESEKRRQERARRKKTDRQEWYSYRLDIFHRTVAQRKKGGRCP